MSNLIIYIIIGVIIVAVLGFVIYNVIKLAKMTPDERKQTLVTYLKGLVALAEKEITGSKQGQEKLKAVEEYFNKKAPMFLKIILMVSGKSNLKDLIETALTEIKQDFGDKAIDTTSTEVDTADKAD